MPRKKTYQQHHQVKETRLTRRLIGRLTRRHTRRIKGRLSRRLTRKRYFVGCPHAPRSWTANAKLPPCHGLVVPSLSRILAPAFGTRVTLRNSSDGGGEYDRASVFLRNLDARSSNVCSDILAAPSGRTWLGRSQSLRRPSLASGRATPTRTSLS